jgi:hypothetical protein
MKHMNRLLTIATVLTVVLILAVTLYVQGTQAAPNPGGSDPLAAIRAVSYTRVVAPTPRAAGGYSTAVYVGNVMQAEVFVTLDEGTPPNTTTLTLYWGPTNSSSTTPWYAQGAVMSAKVADATVYTYTYPLGQWMRLGWTCGNTRTITYTVDVVTKR